MNDTPQLPSIDLVVPPKAQKQFHLGDVVIYAIGGFIVLWFGYSFFFVSFFGPNVLQHVSNLIEVHRTPDESLADFSCGDFRISVVHSDYADKGQGATIDTQGYAPRIEQLYQLTAYKAGKELFTYPPERHTASPVQVTVTLQPEPARKAFVIDEDQFAAMNAEPGSYRDAVAVIFEGGANIPEEDVQALATCYATHAQAFDVAWQKKVSSFIVADWNSVNQTHSFTCTDGHTVVAEWNGFTRLDGVTQNIIGIIGIDGKFYPYTDDAYIASAIGPNKVPVTKRTVAAWATCVDESGLSFPDYVKNNNRTVVVTSSWYYLKSAPRQSGEGSTGKASYFIEDGRVYFGNNGDGKVLPMWKTLIPDADVETFFILSSGREVDTYAKDKNHVYRGGDIVPDANPATFTLSPY